MASWGWKEKGELVEWNRLLPCLAYLRPSLPPLKIPSLSLSPIPTDWIPEAHPQVPGPSPSGLTQGTLTALQHPGLTVPFPAVLRAQVLASEVVGPAWQRLALRVLAVYKQRAPPVRRGGQEAWVPGPDLACGCLRLQPGTDYLLLGSAAGDPDPARLVLDRHGLALPWRPRWARPLRRLQQEEHTGGCDSLRPPARASPLRTRTTAEWPQKPTKALGRDHEGNLLPGRRLP